MHMAHPAELGRVQGRDEGASCQARPPGHSIFLDGRRSCPGTQLPVGECEQGLRTGQNRVSGTRTLKSRQKELFHPKRLL